MYYNSVVVILFYIIIPDIGWSYFLFLWWLNGWCGDVVGSLIQLPFTSSELVVSKHGLNFDNSSYFSMSQKKLKSIAVMKKISWNCFFTWTKFVTKICICKLAKNLPNTIYLLGQFFKNQKTIKHYQNPDHSLVQKTPEILLS